MKYRDLNAPPAQSMAEIVKALRDQSRSSKTGAHGVKHMGPGADVTWGRPGGDRVSIRDVDGDLQAAQGRIEDTEQSLAESGQRLDDAEATIGTVSEDLTRVETVVIPGAVADLNEAVDDLNEAIDNIVVDDTGAVTYQTPYEPDASTDPAPKAGDIWFDTSDNMKLHRYDGTRWVSAADGRIDTIRQAQDDLESDIDRVRTSVDGKNAVTQSTSTPPSQYGGAEGDIWEIMSSMGSGGRSVSRWRWNGTVWVSNLIGDTVLGNVDAAKIGTGYLNANRIEAGTVSADKLLIGAGGNLIAWGQVTSGITTEPHFKWANSSNLSFALAPVDSERGVLPHMVVSRYNTSSENYVAMLMASSGRKPPGVVGESYTFSVTLYSDTPDTKASIQLATYTSDGTSTSGYIAHIASSPVVDLSPEPLTLKISGKAPEGTQFLAPLIRASGPADIGVVSPSLRPQVGATLIEDGAITTDKIETGAITAESGIIESLNAGVITSGTIDAARIGANTITADKLLVGEFIDLAPSVASYAGEWEFHGPAQVINLSRGYDGKGIQFLEGSDPRAFGPRRDTKPGDVWRLEAYFENYSGGTGEGRIGAYFYDAGGAYISLTYAATGSNAVAGTVTVPESAAFIRLVVRLSGDASGGPITARDVHGQRQAGATLIEDGAITTDKITFTEELSGEVAKFMDTESKNLIVTEDTLLNHVTALGQTIVEDINVTGKLIGEDGVFTGTVDFANVNVTGELIGDMISGEHIYGTILEGGEIRTTGSTPGRVTLSDTAYIDAQGGGRHPGIRVDPVNAGSTTSPPGIGPNENGMIISGGRDAAGSNAYSIYAPQRVQHVWRQDNLVAGLSTGGSEASLFARTDTYQGGIIRVDLTSSSLETRGSGGGLQSTISAQQNVASLKSWGGGVGPASEVQATGDTAEMFTRAGGADRTLRVDAEGVWVGTSESGEMQWYNLELTANDSGWISFPTRSGIQRSGSPAYRIKGGIVYFRGTLTKSSSWSSGWNTFASGMTEIAPSFNALRAGASSATSGMLLQMTSSGQLEMWLPSSMSGSTTVQLSPMFYPIG